MLDLLDLVRSDEENAVILVIGSMGPSTIGYILMMMVNASEHEMVLIES